MIHVVGAAARGASRCYIGGVTEPPPEPAPKKEERDEDVAVVWGTSDDRETLGVLRRRRGQLEAGVARKAKEGKPIDGELVRLVPREGSPLCDVEVLYEPPRTRRAGPAQVANARYRDGWERLFGDPDPSDPPS